MNLLSINFRHPTSMFWTSSATRSFYCLLYKSIAFSNARSPQSAIQCCPFRFSVSLVSLGSSTSCLLLLPRLSVTITLPSFFSPITCFRRHFLRKTWPIHLAFPLSIMCSIFLSFTLCNNFLFFTRSVQQISPFFSSTTFENLPGISDAFSEVSKFQYHAKLRYKCSALLVSSLNLSPICWRKESSYSYWKLLLPWQS